MLRKMPKDIFETLHSSVLAGNGRVYRDYDFQNNEPHCIYGHANSLQKSCSELGVDAVYLALHNANISRLTNDAVIREYEEKHDVTGMPWDEYVKALDIVPE